MYEIDGICKSYFGNPVLKPIRFCVPPGGCIGITGENGSGKSTLLRILAQVEEPDRGDIRYQGRSVLGDRVFLRRSLGYVPQNNELLEDLTVRSQLKLWQSACGLSGPLPEILIMDEATTGLDREYTEKLLNWLENHLRTGGSILWCSHQQEELARLCGACIRLSNGQTINER